MARPPACTAAVCCLVRHSRKQRAWLCLVHWQDGCYGGEVCSEKLVPVLCGCRLCQPLALLLYPVAALMQGREVVRLGSGWFEAGCIGCTPHKQLFLETKTFHMLLLLSPLLTLAQNVSWKSEVGCVIHHKLHVRCGFGAGLALPSSPQPGRSAFP